jgi:hypothetical protein
MDTFIMWKQVSILRAIWNVFVSLSSAAWILMLTISVSYLLQEPTRREESLLTKFVAPYHASYFKIAQISVITAGLLLAILLPYLVFVSAKKLWPVGPRPKDE